MDTRAQSAEKVYHCFTRTWWRVNYNWPGGLEPCPGRKRYERTSGCHSSKRRYSLEEAKRACAHYNATHDAGKLSRKMEFEEA